MKKIFLLLIAFLGYQAYYGQERSLNKGVEHPVPTISSLATYTNIPVSVQTGIPKISYNLVNVPTNNNSVNINLMINYHAANVTEDLWSGDLGSGWSLLGQGVISRDNYQDPDESFDDNTKTFYFKNDFNDIYNYNIPGESGRFKFVRDTLNNSFQLLKLTPTTSKITYQRNSNQSTLIIDSFTITSDTGIKYKFETYNKSTASVWRWSFDWLNDMYGKLAYRSAFFLTTIEDENNQELAKFTYFRDLVYVTGTGNTVTESELNKLSRIEIKDRGIIDMEYGKKQYVQKGDQFWLKSMTLKTINNQFVSKYIFDVNNTLTSYSKVDINNTILEKTNFGYGGNTEIPTIYPPVEEGENVYGNTLLNTISLPTGGVIEYNFEMIPYFSVQINKEIPAPTENIGNVGFNQFGSTRKYFFTLAEDKKITIESPVGSLSGYLWSLIFYKKVGNTYQIAPYSLGNAFSDDPSNYPEKNEIKFKAGEYYAALSSTSPAAFPEPLFFDAVKKVGDSTVVTEIRSSRRGIPRIKNIKYYNDILSVPSRVEEYSYKKFENPAVESGHFEGGGFLSDGISPANPVLIYKNVKVSGGTEGYTNYYFKATDAYPEYSEPSPYPGTNYRIIPNYNFTREGLLEKKEIYSITGQKVSEDLLDYIMEDYPAPPYPLMNNGISNTPYTKTAWMKNETITSRNYFNSGITETKKVIFNNTNNYRPNLEKVTSFDGSIQEVKYKYALDKNIQKLITANIIGIPLESETTQTIGAVTKTISKTETKYDNPLNLLPSSVLSTDLQNVTSTEVTYDQYDLKGNLQQYTTKDGISTVIIWGYNQTQPIAKIEGAKLTDIQQSLIDSIVNASDTDALAASGNDETAFLSALSSFRSNTALSGYQTTTYTYDPLVGVRSITSPSGIRESYVYDSANRLEKVIDVNGKVLKEMKYNYKN
ncbi:hypothetical protein [Chryseobacterium indologenes]|uniref:hypothetical protein n=1 Tax=Chryseobacterium indologenes TaxID=253 RepID=UPI001BCCE768|nr:hypothetical protein [Chryseobacterium indologenes]